MCSLLAACSSRAPCCCLQLPRISHCSPTCPPPPPPPPQRLADVVNDEGFRSLEGKSKHQLWLELCDLVTKHPNEVKVRLAGLRGWG